MLEVAVGDGAGRVVDGDHGGLEVWREREAPEIRRPQSVEVDPAHASLGGVHGAQEVGFLGDYLGQVRGSLLKAGGQGREGVDVVPQGAINPYPVAPRLLESELEGTEETGRPWDGHRDEAELA